MQNYDIAFVCDGRRFETQAAFLAASIRRAGERDRIVQAYVPIKRLEEISPEFKALCETLSVGIVGFEASGNWNEPYPIGNKIIALAQERDSAFTLFLDTDIVMTGAPVLPEPMHDGHFLAAMQSETAPRFRGELDWSTLYDLVGQKTPKLQSYWHRSATEFGPPYFNAGVLLMSNQKGENGKSFAQAWLAIAERLDHSDIGVPKRPWLDQLSLPVAVAACDAEFVFLPEELNYSSYQRRVRSLPAEARLFHYHQLTILGRKRLSGELVQFMQKSGCAQMADRCQDELDQGIFAFADDSRIWKKTPEPAEEVSFPFLEVTGASPRPMVTHFQVFGERCSGIHVADHLIRRNLGVEFTNVYGWPHAFPSAPIISDKLLAVIVVRDPIDWLEELHLRPFETGPELQDMPFRQFLRSPWLSEANNANGRWTRHLAVEDHLEGKGVLQFDLDPLSGLPFSNPMQLRRAKLKAHAGYLNRASNAVLCRYEDICDQPEAFVESLSQRFHIPKRHKFSPVEPGHHYLHGPRQKSDDISLSDEDRRFVMSELDLETERGLGYFQSIQEFGVQSNSG